MDEKQLSKTKLLGALLTEPTTYHIGVQNSSSLPKGYKKQKEISFTIDPPVMSTLAKMAQISNGIPDELKIEKVPVDKLMPYTKQMCQIIAILAHGNKDGSPPEWHAQFLEDNITPKEAMMMFQELTIKIRTDFFLPSFQIANLVNPMTMMTKKEMREEAD